MKRIFALIAVSAIAFFANSCTPEFMLSGSYTVRKVTVDYAPKDDPLLAIYIMTLEETLKSSTLALNTGGSAQLIVPGPICSDGNWSYDGNTLNLTLDGERVRAAVMDKFVSIDYPQSIIRQYMKDWSGFQMLSINVIFEPKK